MRQSFALFSLFFLLLSYQPLVAQLGTVSGVVVDSSTSEPLIGATVSVSSQSGRVFGAFTGEDGSFSMNNVPIAKGYTVKATYYGYDDREILNVEVVGGQAVSLRIEMQEGEYSLNEVTLTAVRKASTEVSVMSIMKESMQIVSGVSAETIKKTLDSDASQVMKRIPGVTVVQDRFVVIRGLSERYNLTLLHNVNAPSMEPDVRSFSMDVLPSSIIDRVLVYKSPAPNLPGDFSGGAIKLYTKGIPDESSLVVDLSTGYRPGSSLKTFVAEERRPLHWTGINDGANDLPSDFPDRVDVLTGEARDNAGKSLPNNWEPTSYNSGLDYKVNLTYSFRKDFGREGQIGNVTGIQYNNSKTIFNMVNRSYEAYDFTAQSSKLRTDFDDIEYGQEIMTGIVHNWAVRLNSNHVVELKNLYNTLTSYDYIDRFGDQVAQGFTQNSDAFYNEYRGLYSGQMVGTHKLFKESMQVEWIGGLGLSFNELPDYRRLRRNVLDPATGEEVLFVPRGQTPDFLGKFYSEMFETIYSGAVNIEQTFNAQKETLFKPSVQFGGFWEYRDREFSARNLGYSRAFDFDESLTQVSVGQLFQPENINSSNGIRLGENFSPNNFFAASNRLMAGYLSVNLPIGPRFNVFGGIRLEDNIQSLGSLLPPGSGGTGFDSVRIEQLILLPSVTLSYNLTSSLILKAVYGRTVNRPEFREIAPFGFYDFIFDATVTGFSGLQNATIDNYDLRLEMYPSPTETISLAFFYKQFQNPIESLYGNFGSEQATFLYRNTESAYARGIELDMRKSLRGLTQFKLLNRTALLVNVSLIDSRVTLGEDLANLLRAKDRPLQGQSNFIVNTGIFYNDEEHDFQVNVLYNVIGKRILLVGAGSIPDTYEMPRNVVDISVSKGLGERFVLRAGIKDLVNQEFLLLQDGNEDGIFDRQNDQIFRRFKPGSVFSLGLSYKIF